MTIIRSMYKPKTNLKQWWERDVQTYNNDESDCSRHGDFPRSGVNDWEGVDKKENYADDQNYRSFN